jgi:hypothetical protein
MTKTSKLDENTSALLKSFNAVCQTEDPQIALPAVSAYLGYLITACIRAEDKQTALETYIDFVRQNAAYDVSQTNGAS